MLLATTFILVLSVLETVPAEAAAVLIAELDRDITITDSGRVVSDEGPRLATIAGNALITPAMPVTLASELPAPQTYHATARILATPRVRVPAGTTFKILATGYSSTPDQTDGSPFITASGTRVHDGTIAVNFLPFGTKVTFPDYTGSKVYIVEDRHSRRLSDRADLWFARTAQALRFGRRTLTMIVVD